MAAVLFLVLVIFGELVECAAEESPADVPVVDLEHGWRLCTMPDLGTLSGPVPRKQQIVDHGLIAASTGQWQLWACLRGTAPGRLLYRWAGDDLRAGDFRPVGIAARARADFGEKVAPAEVIQAPFFLREDGRYLCFYNSNGIRLMTSSDGVTYVRRPEQEGGSLLYSDGGRDVMVVKHEGRYLAYSTVSEGDRGFVVLRESADLVDWTPRRIVCEGGRAGTGPVTAESPFVVRRAGVWYLFRASSTDFKTYVYRSEAHDDFGHGDDRKLITVLPLKAPEIVVHDGQHLITDLADFQGIRIYPLGWRPAD